MRIAIRGGHTERCGGAVALLSELTEDRKVKDSAIKYLKQLGHEVLDVTPPVNYTSDEYVDLAYGVDKANNWKADLFVSIHFNKAYTSYNGAIGTEVWVYSQNEIAKRVVNSLSSLGFTNRGQKVGQKYYELRNTSMNAMIIETCFIEATEDVKLYNKLGYDKIGQTIAEAIANKKTQTVTNNLNYKVKITADVLNVRKGPGSNYPIVTTVKENEVYTIIGEENGWGKLKSGAGYISLSYTKRI